MAATTTANCSLKPFPTSSDYRQASAHKQKPIILATTTTRTRVLHTSSFLFPYHNRPTVSPQQLVPSDLFPRRSVEIHTCPNPNSFFHCIVNATTFDQKNPNSHTNIPAIQTKIPRYSQRMYRLRTRAKLYHGHSS